MFTTAVCYIFLIKLRWTKTKGLYDESTLSKDVLVPLIATGWYDACARGHPSRVTKKLFSERSTRANSLFNPPDNDLRWMSTVTVISTQIFSYESPYSVLAPCLTIFFIFSHVPKRFLPLFSCSSIILLSGIYFTLFSILVSVFPWIKKRVKNK